MTRQQALDRAAADFAGGGFVAALAPLIAVPTESQEPGGAPHLAAYLTEHIRPRLEQIGFVCDVLVNPAPGGPILFAERIEDPDLPTVLIYGHGDVIRGLDDAWSEGLSPWTLTERDGRIYGRGVADNKGQHAIAMAALSHVVAVRGKLGFNAKVLLETSEEIGSPGLREVCEAQKDLLAADLLIASDGPRLEADTPTLSLGSRGVVDFDLVADLRASGHHSGNWGGLLANPAILIAHAVATLIGPDGAIRVPELKPRAITPSVRRTLAEIDLRPGPDDPSIDHDWGEPGLKPAEQVFGWNSLEVLAWSAGTPENPINAVPPSAWARMQIRYTADSDPEAFLPAVSRALGAAGLGKVEVRTVDRAAFRATRTDPEHRWVRFVRRSIERTAGKAPVVLPNTGGSLPNDCFADILGLPTLWIPHSYRGCQQHAADEHALPALLHEGLLIMTGLFWDLGESNGGKPARATSGEPVQVAASVEVAP